MAVITTEYLQDLAPIYRDILSAYPALEPHRSPGDGLAFQTIYVGLREKYSLGDIRRACEEMTKGGAMILRLNMFACPTMLGEEIITELMGGAPAENALPPFLPPPGD